MGCCPTRAPTGHDSCTPAAISSAPWRVRGTGAEWCAALENLFRVFQNYVGSGIVAIARVLVRLGVRTGICDQDALRLVLVLLEGLWRGHLEQAIDHAAAWSDPLPVGAYRGRRGS